VRYWKAVRFIRVERLGVFQKALLMLFVYMRQQALVVIVVACIPIIIAQLVLNMHMGFQSIFKVWEVPQTRLAVSRFDWRPSVYVAFPTSDKEFGNSRT